MVCTSDPLAQLRTSKLVDTDVPKLSELFFLGLLRAGSLDLPRV